MIYAKCLKISFDYLAHILSAIYLILSLFEYTRVKIVNPIK